MSEARKEGKPDVFYNQRLQVKRGLKCFQVEIKTGLKPDKALWLGSAEQREQFAESSMGPRPKLVKIRKTLSNKKQNVFLEIFWDNTAPE